MLSSLKESLAPGAKIFKDTSKDIERDSKIFCKPCYCEKKAYLSQLLNYIDENHSIKNVFHC